MAREAGAPFVRLPGVGHACYVEDARRFTREQHLAKFRRCLDFAQETLRAGTAETLIDLVDRLEHLADVRELTAPLLA